MEHFQTGRLLITCIGSSHPTRVLTRFTRARARTHTHVIDIPPYRTVKHLWTLKKSPMIQYNLAYDIMQISFILTRESVRFNGHFSRWTWVSRYQNVSISDFIGAKDGGSGGDNRRYKTCKAPVIVKLSPPTNQHPFFAGWMPFLSPNQQCQSTEAKSITYPKV